MSEFVQYAMAPMPGSGNKTAGGSSDPMMTMLNILPFVLIFVVFYFLFIMPQRRQQKQHTELLKTLKKNDEVITTGGMFGVIIGFNEKDDTVYLKMSEGVKIEMQRSSISGLRTKKTISQSVVK